MNEIKEGEKIAELTKEREVESSLVSAFGPKLKEIKIPRKRRMFIRVDRTDAKPVIAHLIDRYGFTHLSTISAVDLGDKIEVVYHLTIPNLVVSVCAQTPKDDPVVETVTDIIPGAALYEREIHDLMGVVSKGNPDLRRLLLHEDWPKDVFPLRKDWKTPRSLTSSDE